MVKVRNRFLSLVRELSNTAILFLLTAVIARPGSVPSNDHLNSALAVLSFPAASVKVFALTLIVLNPSPLGAIVAV